MTVFGGECLCHHAPHVHAILFDVQFNSERLKHTLDVMRKFTGRQLVEHASLHLPKVYMVVFKVSAGKDRQHRFCSRPNTR